MRLPHDISRPSEDINCIVAFVRKSSDFGEVQSFDSGANISLIAAVKALFFLIS
jgi:hypothetical protein